MSTVRTRAMPNRLAHFINTADGVTLPEALAQAEANLQAIRPPGLERIDEVLAELSCWSSAQPSPSDVERLYRLANELAGTAGVFGLPTLGRAAYSLCELLDRVQVRGWNTAAVNVHLNGLRLLRGEGDGSLDAQAAMQVLSGLEQVTGRFTELC